MMSQQKDEVGNVPNAAVQGFVPMLKNLVLAALSGLQVARK